MALSPEEAWANMKDWQKDWQKPAKTSPSKGARLMLRLGETEHEGDLDSYANDVVKSGGRVLSQRVLQERHDDDGDVEDYETGEMEIEVPHDKISDFAAKFPKTDAGAMAGFDGYTADQLEKRLKASTEPKKAPPPPPAEATEEQRKAARTKAEEHKHLSEVHRNKLIDELGGGFKAERDGRGAEAAAHRLASEQHKAAAFALRSSVSEDPRDRARHSVVDAQAASEKAHKLSVEAGAAGKPKEEPKPPPPTVTPEAKQSASLAKFAQAKKLPGAIETGKRGGKFYTTATGAKVYVKS